MNYDKDVDEIHMYYSPVVLRSSLCNPASFMIALKGFSTASLPIVIGDTKLKGVSFNAPTTFMTAAGNGAAFKDLLASAAAGYRYNNFLRETFVTLQLMQAYVKSPAKDFINAYRKYDKLEEAPTDSDVEAEDFELLDDEPEYPTFSKKNLCALLYVWGAANHKFDSKLLTASYPQSELIQTWCKKWHDACIPSASLPFLSAPFQWEVATTCDTVLIQAFTEMKETVESSRKGTSCIMEEKVNGARNDMMHALLLHLCRFCQLHSNKKARGHLTQSSSKLHWNERDYGV